MKTSKNGSTSCFQSKIILPSDFALPGYPRPRLECKGLPPDLWRRWRANAGLGNIGSFSAD